MNGTGRTLYANLPPWVLWAILAIVVALTILPSLPHLALYLPCDRHRGVAEPLRFDPVLYKNVVTDIGNGQSYYDAAGAEHRRLHFPTFPLQVFRMPVLAWMLAALHFYAFQVGVLFALYGAIIVLFYRELLAARLTFAGRM